MSPTAAPHGCTAPGCRALVPRGRSRCDEHRTLEQRKDNVRRGTAHERGYTARWRESRLAHLRESPLCVQCEGYGRVVPAEVVDHVVPHRGDMALFWDSSNWQSLCARCHNRKTALEDGGMGSAAVLPPTMSPSLVPLTVVAGAPGSGKTTWTHKQATPADLVLDLDELRARMSGCPWYEAPEDSFPKAMRARNAELARLTSEPVPWPRAWLIASAPTPAARRWWRSRAGARVVVLETPLEECLRRIAGDTRRRLKESHVEACRAWWGAYRRDSDDEVLACD